ncbi:MAG: RNA polymerase sigma factor [Oscillospiraceae bacterium]|nr:RNA polymerase sigma factor [Oscillospiraceae bacterium]
MTSKSVRPTDEIETMIRNYSKMLFKISLVMLCNEYDAQDAVQETFIRYFNKSPVFDSDEHKKAWLITVVTNICKNMRKYKLKHNHLNIDELYDYYETKEDATLLESLMMLPQKFKVVLLLHYVEGYKVNEISKMLSVSPSAIKMRLQKARKLLKEKLGEEIL